MYRQGRQTNISIENICGLGNQVHVSECHGIRNITSLDNYQIPVPQNLLQPSFNIIFINQLQSQNDTVSDT
jgi:hypothetical protein